MSMQNSKSILAKLLAQENLTVVHAKAPTASFDTANRVLTLPIWKEMDGDLYDLLVGHEVGHAQFTPPEGWHTAICGPDGDIKNADQNFKGFLNIIEDARIEKKIKSRFPGLRGNFYRAYAGLHERDFFQIADKNISELLLIDRINLHFKLGSFVGVPFTQEEKVYIQRIEKLETWDEVVAIARELYDKAKQEIAQGKNKLKMLLGEMQDGDIDEDADFEEFELDLDDLTPEQQEILTKTAQAITDQAFRENEKSLLDPTSQPYAYYTLPEFDSRKFTVGYKDVLSQMTFRDDQLARAPALLQEFRKKNDKVINYLIKEFELRRNAEQQARAKISKSGELDMKKVFNYQITEDIFRRFTVLPNGKNHGLIMFFDMSGSMSNIMSGVIEQMLVLVEFCRKVNIPFEVYGFTNGAPPDQEYINNISNRDSKNLREIAVVDSYFTLRQYFTDKMRAGEYKTMLSNLVLESRIHQIRTRYSIDDPMSRHLPEAESLNGTPLNPALIVSIDVYNRFIERTKAEIVNLVVLTDGDSDDSLHERTDETYRRNRYVSSPANCNVFLTHARTKKQIKFDKHDNRHTRGLAKLVGEVTGANMICFDLITNSHRGVIGNRLFKNQNTYDPNNQNKIDIVQRQLRRDGIHVIENQGWSEHYLVLANNLATDDDEFEVEAGATKSTILRAFASKRSSRLQNRLLLNRFIKMIA